jgi:hypothetical protein
MNAEEAHAASGWFVLGDCSRSRLMALPPGDLLRLVGLVGSFSQQPNDCCQSRLMMLLVGGSQRLNASQ